MSLCECGERMSPSEHAHVCVKYEERMIEL